MSIDKLQEQINLITTRLNHIEHENTQLKCHSQTKQFYQNFANLDAKYLKLFRKYMKCLYKYGVYQSALNHMITHFNALLDTLRHDSLDKYSMCRLNFRNFEKLTLHTCLAKFGSVYDNNKVIGEPQMEAIINQRAKKESIDNKLLFFQNIDENEDINNTIRM